MKRSRKIDRILIAPFPRKKRGEERHKIGQSVGQNWRENFTLLAYIPCVRLLFSTCAELWALPFYSETLQQELLKKPDSTLVNMFTTSVEFPPKSLVKMTLNSSENGFLVGKTLGNSNHSLQELQGRFENETAKTKQLDILFWKPGQPFCCFVYRSMPENFRWMERRAN